MNANFGYLFDNPYNIHYHFDRSGTAWFYAGEIANYLGYADIHSMLRMCYPNETKIVPVNNPTLPEIGLEMTDYLNFETAESAVSNRGGARRFSIVNEFGLYNIILSSRSDRPEVEQFRYWVRTILLPSIRKHNSYIDPEVLAKIQADPNFINTVIAENEAYHHQASLQPLYRVIDKSQYPFNDYEQMKKYQAANQEFTNVGRTLYQGNENITLNQLAKIISQSLNSRFGATQLKALLRENNFLMKTARDFNKPTQLAISRGLMVFSYPKDDQDQYEVLVTPAGVKYFINLLISKGYAD